MKSKEAVRIIDKYGIELPVGCAAEIVNLILELQKYKDLCKELEGMFEPGKVFYVSKNKNFEEQAQKIMDLKYIIDELKEKYFPEPKPKETAERFLIDKFEMAIKKFVEDLYGVVIFKAKMETERDKKK